MANLTKSPAKVFVQEPDWLPCLNALLAAESAAQLGTANRVFLTPLAVPRPAIVDKVSMRVTTAGGGATNLRLGIYSDNGNKPDNAKLLAGSANIAADAVGVKTFTLSAPIRVPAGILWIALETADAIVQFKRAANLTYSDITGEKLAGCRYDLGGFGAFTDPCPATTADEAAAFIAALHILSYLE